MIKKVLLALALICPMLLSAQTFKVGLVDFDAIIQAHPDYEPAMNQFKELNDKYAAEYQKLGEELQRLGTEYQESEGELPAIRERKAKAFQDCQQRMAMFEQTVDNELRKAQSDLLSPIQTKVVQAVESVGREGNYSLIEIKSQIVLYFEAPVEDITPLVKAKLGIK